MTDLLFAQKRILLGVTGGIAAYKSAILASKLVQAGSVIQVVMTAGAQQFITPLTFQALTHHPVYTDIFSIPAQTNIPHIDLAKQTDLLIIAPATANTLAKLATGLADNLLTTIALATPAPVLIAPAMESAMWQHPATRANITRLVEWGATVVGPAEGHLASGANGPGRMVEPETILYAVRRLLAGTGDMAGKQVVITAGGTREAIDPVRYISNRSSGKMGYALAEAAHDRGADVTLITTVERPVPPAITVVAVNTAAEMLQAVLASGQQTDVLVMAAAVADYSPAAPADHKLKKHTVNLTLSLIPTTDILLAVAAQRRQTGYPRRVVGFAAETESLLENAADKLSRKHLDLIIANDITRPNAGFGVDTNLVTILSPSAPPETLPLMTKLQVANHIWDKVNRLPDFLA